MRRAPELSPASSAAPLPASPLLPRLDLKCDSTSATTASSAMTLSNPFMGAAPSGRQLDHTAGGERRLRGFGGLASAGAVEIGLGLLDLIAERFDGLAHAVERLGLEVGNHVHGVVDVLE